MFDRLFATGTRTVRGLEATSLGTPPVPGQAIVHRPKSDHLTTVGGILHREVFERPSLTGKRVLRQYGRLFRQQRLRGSRPARLPF